MYKYKRIEKSYNNPTSWELFEEKLGFRFKEAQLSKRTPVKLLKILCLKLGLPRRYPNLVDK